MTSHSQKHTARSRSRRESHHAAAPPVVPEHIEQTIVVLRGQKVLIDEHLSGFYNVEVRSLIQAVKRNIKRFPADFMFQMTDVEWDALKSQNVMAKPRGRGGRRSRPYAFTEQGVAMLSSVLRSKRAIEVNIEIMRAFVRLRQLISAHKQLASRIARLEHQMIARDAKVNHQIQQIIAVLDHLFNPPATNRKPIGFHSERD